MKVTVDPWSGNTRGIYLEWLMITMYQSELLIAFSHYPRVLSPESRSQVNVVHFHIPPFYRHAIVAAMHLYTFATCSLKMTMKLEAKALQK